MKRCDNERVLRLRGNELIGWLNFPFKERCSKLGGRQYTDWLNVGLIWSRVRERGRQSKGSSKILKMSNDWSVGGREFSLNGNTSFHCTIKVSKGDKVMGGHLLPGWIIFLSSRCLTEEY